MAGINRDRNMKADKAVNLRDVKGYRNPYMANVKETRIIWPIIPWPREAAMLPGLYIANINGTRMS